MAQKQFMTQEGYNTLLKRLEELKQAQNENIIALQEARAQGDLSENADYDAARNAQAQIAAELKEVENSIKNAEIIKDEEDTNMGKLVKVRFLDDNVEETYHIVGTIEADPMVYKISSESPLGKAVLHAKKNDVVLVRTEDGERFEVKVLNIKKAEEEKKKSSKSK